MSDKDDRLMAAIERLQSAQANPPDESAQLRDQLEQERAKSAALEKGRETSQRLLSDAATEAYEADEKFAALQQRCARLEAALRGLDAAAVDRLITAIPNGEHLADMVSELDGLEFAKEQTQSALAPDAGTGVSKEGYEGLGFGPKIEGYIKKP